MVKNEKELLEAIKHEHRISKEITDPLIELDQLPSTGTQVFLNDLIVELYKRVVDVNDDIVVEIFAENKCEQMIYGLLAGPFEMKPEEVAGLELDVLAEKLEQLGKENDIRRFFTVLSGLLSKTR